MKKGIFIILILFFIGVASFAGYKILGTLLDYGEGENAYDSLRESVSTSPDSALKTPAPSHEEGDLPPASETEPEETPDPHEGIDFPTVDFEALLDMNSDVVGWIYLEGSPVDYPIVQGEDNDEYIRMLPDGRYNNAGSIFMDYRNSPDFSDRHTIIYGHRMNNNSMFGTIVNYKDQEWYDAHPRCFIMTEDENYVVEFFSGCVMSVTGEAWDLEFESDEDFNKWVARAKTRSAFESDVVPEAGERIITLSTCNRTNGYTRFVLLGVVR